MISSTRHAGFRPAYLGLSRRELWERVERALAGLADCRVCPRDCRVNRLEDRWAACKTGRHAVVGSWFPHFGEEDCLRGWNGSGTIFFSHCNLRCVFCLHPDTPVATENGRVRIAEVFDRAGQRGDDHRVRAVNGEIRVRTRPGRLAPLARAFRHPYRGELVRLQPFDSSPLLLTPDHRVFAVGPRDAGRAVRVRSDELTREHRVLSPDADEPSSSPKWSGRGHLVPIKGIDRVAYQGPVYNLEVDDPDHSYVAGSVAVTNCQNYDISQAVKPQAQSGSPPEEIARMMLALQARGCHNINFVTPEHVAPQVLEAVAVAVEEGLRLPIVYNTSAYDSLESIELMRDVVDIYMPDFKYWSRERSATYLKAEDYPDAARAAIRAMHDQVGPLVVGPDGLARRGLLVRHLVMPESLDETRAILEWIAIELGPETYVNLMDQYHPAGKVGGDRYPELGRRTSSAEFGEARAIARDLGLRNLDERRPHPQLRRRLAAL